MRIEDWIVIMLAGVTVLVTLFGVMLAMLAIALGVAALWGYNGMLEAACKAATTAAKQVSLDEVTKRATQAAQETAQRIIWENKDEWLNASALGLELPVAQSELPQEASKQVSDAYPGDLIEEAQVAEMEHPDAGANHPQAPNDGPH